MIYIDVKSNRARVWTPLRGYQMNCAIDLFFVNYDNFISSNFLLDKLGVHSG
ncbi:hypothetical protein FHY31_002044 [Xanthomonas euvesicatoria]|uniref:Uncharacterized protein n=1 Tax=Xanthomonas euvesicatoria TaxID=456327 RepID=A0AAW3U1X4_XANEU|nr:hypothetical protein [Xanthomonas euvesicatoria]MBB4870300.1 hypothetical protein [Xanthomonas euvesicatoria]